MVTQRKAFKLIGHLKSNLLLGSYRYHSILVGKLLSFVMEDFFLEGFKPRALLTIGAMFSLAGVLICIVSFLYLIWSRRFLPGNNQTLITMLVSSLQWSMVEYLGLVTSSDILRYFYGPFPHNVCLVKSTVTAALVLQMLLFATAIIITRSCFIALVKNLAALDDKFWTIFLNLWIRMVVYTIQIVSLFSPGSELIIFYLCSGKKPAVMSPDSFKLRNLQVIISVFTFVNVSLLSYIHYKKIKISMMDTGTVAQSIKIFASDPLNKSDFLTLAIGSVIIILTAILLSFFNLVDPSTLNTFPNYIVLHAFRFGWPVFVSFIMIGLAFQSRKKHSRVF